MRRFPVRDLLGVIAGFLFVYFYSGGKAALCLVPVAAVIALGHLSLKGLHGFKRKGFFLALLLSLFVWYLAAKNIAIPQLVGERLRFPVIIGASYVFLRVLMVLFDRYKNAQLPKGLAADMHYVFFAPALYTGPIQEHGDFQYAGFLKDFGKRFLLFASRGAWGLTKISGLGYFIANYAVDFDNVQWFSQAYANILVSLLLYTLYLYLNFSGATDIVLALSQLLGYQLPENFDAPYRAHSIKDFWHRWHISLTSFLRTRVFRPFVHKAESLGVNERLGSRAVTYLGYLLVFILSALWHNVSVNFVLWGLWHAGGMMLCDRLGFVFHKIFPSRWLAALAGWFLTMLFVAFGWLFFQYPSSWVLSKVLYAPTVSIEVGAPAKEDAHYKVGFRCTSYADGASVEFKSLSEEQWHKVAVEKTADGAYASVIRNVPHENFSTLLLPDGTYEFRLSCLRRDSALYGYKRSLKLTAQER